MLRHLMLIGLVCLVSLALPEPAGALDKAQRERAQEAIEAGVDYLRQQQNEDGSWSPDAGPAVTALAVTVMLDRPAIGPEDPAVAAGLDYILDKARPSGGIHDGVLKNYNTAICLSALSRVKNRPGISEVVRRAQDYLRDLQWHDQKPRRTGSVGPDHPHYGGAGYGHGGRPDLSNTQLMLQALHDSGVPSDDPAFKRALRFITRTQGVPQNDLHGKRIEDEGGFIYATTLKADLPGVAESKANPTLMEKAKELAEEGQDVAEIRERITGLRAYGSMTYAGLKSYIYAMPGLLERDDPRVQAAFDWIRQHYTLRRNPGMPESMKHQGLYYYYMTFGRALNAWGRPTIRTTDGESRDWAHDLIEAVVTRQREDGAWVNDRASRWMEDDPQLVTCYSLIALENAID
jgi:squalene-hopene/tetraprenyl-beta-curcumene cyclase